MHFWRSRLSSAMFLSLSMLARSPSHPEIYIQREQKRTQTVARGRGLSIDPQHVCNHRGLILYKPHETICHHIPSTNTLFACRAGCLAIISPPHSAPSSSWGGIFVCTPVRPLEGSEFNFENICDSYWAGSIDALVAHQQQLKGQLSAPALSVCVPERQKGRVWWRRKEENKEKGEGWRRCQQRRRRQNGFGSMQFYHSVTHFWALP